MKTVMTLCVVVGALLATASTATASLVVDADAYAAGTDISNAFAGVTLSAVGTGWNNAGPGIFAVDPSGADLPFTPTTGSLVFGTDDADYPAVFREAGFLQLRADFDVSATSVSLDFIANDTYDVGELKAYDAADNLITRVVTSDLSIDEFETLTIVAADIAYVIAGGVSGMDSIGLDHLVINPVPVPGAIVLGLFGLGAAGAKLRRRRA